jgi:hypothetical protein
MIGITGIFISFLFLLWVRYFFQGSKVDLMQFDVATVTAGDYSVEVKIPKEAYNEWAKEFEAKYDETSQSRALVLKKQLKNEIEAIVKQERMRQDLHLKQHGTKGAKNTHKKNDDLGLSK